MREIQPNYEGPYLVTLSVIRGGFNFGEMNRDVLHESFNSDSVKILCVINVYSHSLWKGDEVIFSIINNCFPSLPLLSLNVFFFRDPSIRRSLPLWGS